MKNSTFNVLAFFVRAYPLQTSLVIFSLFTMALMEAFGIATLLPLISTLSEGMGGEASAITKGIHSFFAFLGVPLELPYLLGFIIVVMIMKSTMMMMAMMQVANSSARVISDLRFSLLNNILSARWGYYTSMATGESVNAMGSEALRSADVYRQACNVLAYAMLVIVYTALALIVTWKLTLAAAVAGVGIIIFFKPLINYGRHYGNQETVLLAESSKKFTEALANVKPVRAMGKEKNYAQMLHAVIKGLAISQKKKIIATDTIGNLSEPVIIIFVACGLYFSITYTSEPVASLFFLAFLFHRIVSRIVSAQRIYQNVVVNESALNALRKRIKDAEDVKEQNLGRKTPVFKTSVTLNNVSFSYGGHDVLKDINLSFAINKFHVIIGGSGAGKTTLIDLIIGFHDPQKGGQILIDDTPLNKIDIQKWRSMIGYVPQDLILFHDTIQHNVTLGDNSISPEDVQDALQKAGAWDFIQNMEHGMETIVGESGAKLSGGQRQRVAIARALVNKPSLLILDEATSSLDKETEQEILRSMKELSKTVTIIAISHQDSTLQYADHVVHLEKGHLQQIS